MPNNYAVQQTDIPDVQVQVGTIEGIGENPLYDNSEIEDGIFQDYWVEQRYESDGQRWMMPVCSPNGFDGDSVAFVQLAGGTLLWIIDWTAEKAGNAPSIPNPTLEDENWVVLDKHIEPAQLTKFPDNTIVYRISGTYVYGCKNPSSAKFHYARPPWMSKQVDCEVADSQFTGGIINCHGEEESSESASPDPESGAQSTDAFDAGFEE